MPELLYIRFGASRVESLPRGVVTRAGGSAGSPIPRRRAREIPWLGRSSSLAWGIERPARRFIMTLEGERICRGPATTKPTEVVHGSDGEADCPPGHRLGDNCWTLLGWRWESQHEVGPSKDDDLEDREEASGVVRRDRPAKSIAGNPPLLRGILADPRGPACVSPRRNSTA